MRKPNGQVRADIEAKKKELESLEKGLAVLDDEKRLMEERKEDKRIAMNRVKVMTYWMEMAKFCLEFLVGSEKAPPTKVMVLAADLLKKSLRPGQHLARLYGRWPAAVDVEAQLDWPTLAKDWAIECWERVAKVADDKEVKKAKGSFLRFARRWMDGKDSRRREKTVQIVGAEWAHFCNAAMVAEVALRKRAESPDSARLVEAMQRLDAAGTEMCNTLKRMDRRLSATATKADVRAATKTVLRGEDPNAKKPGPQMTEAKRRQIKAAENYRRTHAGCTLHNACLKSFSSVDGGFKSAGALYAHLHGRE